MTALNADGNAPERTGVYLNDSKEKTRVRYTLKTDTRDTQTDQRSEP